MITRRIVKRSANMYHFKTPTHLKAGMEDAKITIADYGGGSGTNCKAHAVLSDIFRYFSRDTHPQNNIN